MDLIDFEDEYIDVEVLDFLVVIMEDFRVRFYVLLSIEDRWLYYILYYNVELLYVIIDIF